MSKLVGTPIKLSIGECLIVKDERDCIRGSFNLLFKKLVDTQIPRPPGALLLVITLVTSNAASGIPVNQERLTFKFRQQRYFSYILVWIIDDGVEQYQEVLRHARDGRSIEQINIVAEVYRELAFRFKYH